MVLGSGSRLGKRIGELLATGEESPEAILVGRGVKRKLRTAVLYNTAIADCTDSAGGYYRGVVHPGKNIVPTSLTVASAKDKSGKDLILAIVTAIECYSRIDSVMAATLGARGFYSDGPVGAIGSAIAAGRLFGLDREGLTGAIGNVAMLAPCTLGGSSMFKSAARPLCLGLGSANSILAVTMAQKGIEGPSDIVECRGGFCQALADVTDLSKVTETLGEKWEITMFYYKPFVGCRLTHLARQGAQALKNEHGLKAEDIKQVIVRQARGALTVVRHHAVAGENIVAHSCSGPYLIANVLMWDDVGPDVLAEARMNDPRIHELADKIEIVEDPELTRRWEKEHLRGGRIEIITKEGKTYSYSGEYAKGDPLDGWRMTDAELRDKFHTFTEGILTAKRVSKIMEIISALEELDTIRTLMNLLA